MYKKISKSKTREIIQNGNIDKAIDNARALEEQYAVEGKNILTNIKDMNPFTSVYRLIEQFMLEISE
ncbi:MAG: RloB family protein [Lachnospiraceae bacterium]|nr:RloB family protein [Lachnospiraceae bacterium]